MARARLLDSERFKRVFVRALGDVRNILDFELIGYVLMPEHFHLLLWPSTQADPLVILRSLKVRTAMKVLEILREHPAQPWCGRMLERLRMPATVHSPTSHRVWQRRFV